MRRKLPNGKPSNYLPTTNCLLLTLKTDHRRLKIMKNKTGLFFLICMSIILFGFQTTDWEYHLSEDKKFSILTPGKLTTTLDTVGSAIGPIFCNNLVYQEKADSVAAIYSLSHCEYPSGTLHSDSTELTTLYFDSTVASMVSSIGGTLLYESEQTYAGYPGRIWKMSYDKGKKWGKFKALMVENRLYILQVRANDSVTTRDHATRFLDSFTLRTF